MTSDGGTNGPAPDAAVKLTEDQRRRVERVADRVPALARALVRNMPQVTLDDLISAGNEGLVQAALRYDPDSGVPFAAFAHYRIRGAMIDCARRTVPAVRRRSRALRAMEASQTILEQAQQEQSVLDAQAVRTHRDRVSAAADIVAQTTVAILLSKLERVDPDRIAADQAQDAEKEILDAEVHSLLHAAIEACSPDDRAFLEALYFEGLSMHDLAARSGKSVATISRYHTRLIRRVGSRLSSRLERT